ncbi:MAG: circadian clock protein KaiC, partial [Desulforhopalus sp.]
TGIKGFDEITFGGLPKGRPTLIAGSAGSGKTLFGMEFLFRGATEFDEPGVFFSFEESEEDLIENSKSLHFGLEKLLEEQKIALDYVHIDRAEIEETGEYDLEGLFVRLGYAIDSIGAKRIVLDTLEALFSGFSNELVLRSEIRRLFRWIKERGVTAIVTGERGSRDGNLTRHGLEEYVSDCVIVLSHQKEDLVSTRRLCVAKYRGSSHGTNEYPFLLENGGIFVLPITSIGLDYEVSEERISSGIPRLDAMFAGKGYFRGSSILISGTAGTGKTTYAAQFANNVCLNGERCLYYAFEESSSQIIRNMRSTGIDLAPHREKGLLQFVAIRPTTFGLETHLSTMFRSISEFQPAVVVIDPITNLISVGNSNEVKNALMRLVDLLKSKLITSLFTSLIESENDFRQNQMGISSLMDTWMLLRDIESGGETNRSIKIIKSRGMGHSNQLREFMFTDKGIDIIDVYTGPGGVLTGSARVAQEAREKAETIRGEQEIEQKKREFEKKQAATEARIAELRANLEGERQEVERMFAEFESIQTAAYKNREQMANIRKADKI